MKGHGLSFVQRLWVNLNFGKFICFQKVLYICFNSSVWEVKTCIMNYSENVNNAIQKVNFKENRPFCVNVQFSFGVCDHIGISEAVEGVGIFHQLRKVENGWTFWNKPVEFGATRWLSGSYGCLGMDLLVIGDNLEEFQRAIRNGIELIRSKHYDILKKHKGEIEKAMLTMETNS